LNDCGVREYIIRDIVRIPKEPKDDEIILTHRNNGPLPPEIIVDIILA
jgi:hypothetical protein